MVETLMAPAPPAVLARRRPLAARLVFHALAPLDARRRDACLEAYGHWPSAALDDMEREIAHVLDASGRDLAGCLDDLDAFNALTPEVDNDAWYDQPRAFTSMHLDALLHGFSRRRLAALCDQVLACVPRPRRVLEVGSGSGRLAALLADATPDPRFTLVDRSEAAVRFARRLHNLRGTGGRVVCVRGDLHALPVADASADVVIAAEVLEHAPNPAAGIRELLRVLAPHGRLAVSLPVDLDIAMHPTVFRSEEEILAAFRAHDLAPCSVSLVSPDPRTDAIADVFPGFTGCVNAVFRRVE